MGKKGRRQPEWARETLELRPDHKWTGKPGCRVFVADRGAVRFDLPQDGLEGWFIDPAQKGSSRQTCPPPCLCYNRLKYDISCASRHPLTSAQAAHWA